MIDTIENLCYYCGAEGDRAFLFANRSLVSCVTSAPSARVASTQGTSDLFLS